MMQRMIVAAVGMAAGLLLAGNAPGADVSGTGATNQAPRVVVTPQTMCPVETGNPINKDIFRDYNGKRVYFCCNMCPKVFDKDPARYVKQLEAAGVTLETTPKGDALKTQGSSPSGETGHGHAGHSMH
jgi:YHS domain-containing protein